MYTRRDTKWEQEPTFSGRCCLFVEYVKRDCSLADPASGGSEDWAKGVAGIKYSYLLELRPHKDSPQGFLLDESEIMPTGKETWEGIRCVADAVISTASSTAFTSTLTTLPMVWCQDMDPFLCRWWAANGGCHMVPSTALRCPRSCRIC
ncbi:hypothetical protein M514_01078 [Trichuris suis]|uniref:Uncharacterized protein n=1 Tax=Trichuris suis TaxID=68888 RepID=A0A085MKU9_9BILA|nr:hypothetical protein M513_01078 [Trichuris suis]KFD61888.1 hypothetical protein M514_01078 [Trichuris suis]